ncbi:Arylesterase [Fusarium coicis]|nr:Arylesterase [Fusarium coicis]
MYDSILVSLCETQGYRVIAPDRRGFGKSDWAGQQPMVPIGFKEPFGDSNIGSVTEKQVSFFETMFFEADPFAVERCLQIYTGEDLSEKIKRFGQIFHRPFLLIHGGNDVAVPSGVSAELVQKAVAGTKLIIYDGGGHGEFATFDAS